MEPYLIELLEEVSLTKEDRPTITFETGTILKVLMETPTAIIVSSDSRFNFTLQVADRDKTWHVFKAD